MLPMGVATRYRVPGIGLIPVWPTPALLGPLDRGVNSDGSDDDICHHDRKGVDQQPVDDPQQRRAGLHFAQCRRLFKEVRTGKRGGGDPADPFEFHWSATPLPPASIVHSSFIGAPLHDRRRASSIRVSLERRSTTADEPHPFEFHWSAAPPSEAAEPGASEMVSESVRTLSHSRSSRPRDSNSARMRVELHPSSSSRIGTRTLDASSLKTVRRAMGVMYLFSETSMVRPSRRLTCSMTWMSELPSPT